MTVVASVAAFSNLPQAMKSFQTRSVDDISMLAYGIAIVALVFWMMYGAYIKSRPVLIGSSISLVLSLLVVTQFFIYS